MALQLSICPISGNKIRIIYHIKKWLRQIKEGRGCQKIEDQTADAIMEDYLEICAVDVEIAKYYSL